MLTRKIASVASVGVLAVLLVSPLTLGLAPTPGRSSDHGMSPPIVSVVRLAALTVTIGVAQAAPIVGAPVTFTATATGGTPPYGYAWDFDDGTIANIRAPSHAFEAAGTYNVSVTVNDAETSVVVQNRSVTVAPGPTGSSNGLGSTAYWIGGLVVLGVAALVVPILWHRPAPPSPPPGATGRARPAASPKGTTMTRPRPPPPRRP